ncbi:putative polyketide hydroxylase [Streptomyces aurantiacus]|uniref:FAD-dependent monooxygenase n=1 Tax=Streptomyces aurantiacus TaxID=47760 RepID=UPI00278D54A8|nr:FAD-dependent monooxygenase [Streptomyces aurantiacus]MDQ0772799.1 putative polyketide hydroxylase [Streptomyces aurantiacus]
MSDTTLLIIGGGPVGLSAALLASQYGVPCVLVEKFPQPYAHPKARGVRDRAMELFRFLGLEKDIQAEAAPAPQHGFVYCDSLAGEEYGRTPPGQEDTSLGPVGASRIPQDSLERILRERVASAPGVEAQVGMTVLRLTQEGDQVRALVEPTAGGAHRLITARYALACDGAASSVRAALDIGLEGETVGYWQSVYWHGDISDVMGDRTAIQFLTAAEDGGFITVAPVDGHTRWLTFRMRGKDSGHPGVLTDSQARDLIEAAVGRPCAAEVVSAATYAVEARVATRYREGSVFLAGDAAHVFAPTGGFGLNTGVQDAHNLIWKIDLVRKGLAPSELLDTYESERRPVAQSNARWSKQNADRFDAVWERVVAKAPLGGPIDRQRAHLAALERDLAFRYRDGAVAGSAAAADADDDSTGFTAAVGRRAPHLWLRSSGERRSVLDLLDGHFTLLYGAGDHDWQRAAAHTDADARLPPVHALRVPGAACDVDPDEFARLYRIPPDGAALVRPDGHIAWMHGRADFGHHTPLITEALRRTLSGDRG